VHPTLGLVCAICATRLPGQKLSKRRANRNVQNAKRKTRTETRTAPRNLPDLVDPGAGEFGTAAGAFLRDDPGMPLGAGMPTGGPLREDGESHRSAWLRLLRADPCSYCGGPGGTVDHVEPKRKPVRGLGGAHAWLNLTGACGGCNGTKGDKGLLVWLAARPVRARPLPRKTPPSPRNQALRAARRSGGASTVSR
jgi:5-methylcytosine-specific restriction endonuclease McrA